MKKLIILLLSIWSLQTAKAQKEFFLQKDFFLNYGCEAPDSIITRYNTDAQRIALSSMYRMQSRQTNSAQIPQPITDIFLKSLIAVYNATWLPQRDTVVDIYRLSTRPLQARDTNAYGLTSLELHVDKNQQWVKDLMQNVFPTSNSHINDLMHNYSLKTSYISPYSNYIAMKSTHNYNMNAIAKDMLTIPGVFSADGRGFWVGDGSYIIVDKITETYIQLTYSYGWGDCPAGCINRRNWTFKIYNDCYVEFVKAWDGHLTMPPVNLDIDRISTENHSIVYPNPFTNHIRISTLLKDINYTVFDISGKTISKGKPDILGNILLTDLSCGVYILEISSENKKEHIRIVKE